MSLLAHPERNVFITGPPGSAYADVAKVLSVRLGRRILDLQVESRKRKLLALSPLLSPRESSTDHYAEVLRECAGRRNLIACLDWDSLAGVPQYQYLLRGFFVVVFADQPEADETSANGGAVPQPPLELQCDLQLQWSGFPVRQLARIITHCLYG